VVDAAAFVTFGADDVQSAHIGDPGAEHDVSSTTGHVGGDRDRAWLAGFGDDRGLALVLLGVEHVVLHTALLQHAREAFGLLHGYGSDQDRAAFLIHLDDLIDDRFEL